MKLEGLYYFVFLLYFALSVTGQLRSPEITEHPADLLVPRNEPATLNCKADGKPRPRIAWFKNGKEFKIKEEGSRHILLENGDLFFLRVLQTKKDDDSGLYWCQASNEVATVRSKNATLEIAVLKDEFGEVPKPARVAEGATALLRCMPPKGHPEPVVVWTKDEKELDPATQHRFKIVDKGSLVITGVRLSDSGKYVCKARNVYGSRETDPVKLSVLVPPHLVSTSGDITGTSESTIELVCRVGGDPPPEVYWEKVSGGDLPIERMSQEENGQVLRIRHVSPEDEGVYSCRAENPVGSVSANISLIIHSRPVITVTPLEARIGVNGTVSFSCKASGSPPPTTYWTHEGTGVVVGTGQMWGEGRVFVDEFNTLTLQKVSKDDQGYYVCSAVGIAGSALARAHLEVQSVTDMPPPLIALGAPNQTLPLGTEGEMPCEAKGTPEPKIKWFFGEKSLQQTERRTVTPLGTLRITNLKVEDTGVYTCEATSASGTTSWTTSLGVASPTNPNVAFFKMPSDTALPEPPPHVTVLSINVTSVTLGWRRGRPGSSSILGYSVQMWSPDIRGPWQSATTSPVSPATMSVGVLVTGLIPNSRYVFVVRASNSHGLSRPSEVTPMTRTLGADSSGDVSLREIRARLAIPSLRLVTVEALTSSSLRVRWQLLVDSTVLEGVYVRYRPIKASAAALSVETVYLHQNPDEGLPDTHVITGLRPATEYEVFVTPFYETVEGQPSAAVRSVTLESIPEISPNDFNFFIINATTVRLSWSPIPIHLANGKVTGYFLQVTDVSGIVKKHVLNVTLDGTSEVVGNLVPGSSYHTTIYGMTAEGKGPLSAPLAFIMPEVIATVGTTMAGREYPALSVDTNYYLIVGIIAASIIVFLFLFGAIFFIYRHRQKSKSQPYFGKSESKDPWCEYPECWNESCKSIGVGTGTSTVNHTLQSRTFQPKATSPSYTKRLQDYETHDHYSIKPTEDLYEDPDGLRLVSFSKYSNNRRCFSPEPYATTPLISDGHYKGALLPGKDLPPNIPLKDILEKSKLEDGSLCGVFTPQNRLLNFNTPHDKEVHLQPIFQFPPPPPSAPEHTLSFNRRNDVGFTRFLQQQLPYSFGGSSFGGSSSGGSQKSHESPLVGPRFPQRPLVPDSRLVPHQEISLVVDPRMDGFKDSFFHQKSGGGVECQVPRSMSAGHGFRVSTGSHGNTDGEGYARPHEGIQESPYSSAVGEGEETEANSSASSCCSGHDPSHDINFVECLRAAGGDPRWGGGVGGDQVGNSSDEGPPHKQGSSTKPPRPTPYKKPRPPVGGDAKNDPVYAESVTSPLI